MKKNKVRSRKISGVLAAATWLLACGCATQWKEHEVFHIPHRIEPSYYQYRPKRLAILPFQNAIDKEDLHSKVIQIGEVQDTRTPEAIAREVCYKHFSILPFEDVELPDVDRALAGAKTTRERLEAVRKRTGADTVIFGKVKRYHHSYWVLASYSTVAVELQMVNIESGDTIWSSDHVEWSVDLSIGIDVWNLVACAYKEYIWRRELRRRFDDLFNDMAKTLPERQDQLRPQEAKPRRVGA